MDLFDIAVARKLSGGGGGGGSSYETYHVVINSVAMDDWISANYNAVAAEYPLNERYTSFVAHNGNFYASWTYDLNGGLHDEEIEFAVFDDAYPCTIYPPYLEQHTVTTTGAIEYDSEQGCWNITGDCTITIS